MTKNNGIVVNKKSVSLSEKGVGSICLDVGDENNPVSEKELKNLVDRLMILDFFDCSEPTERKNCCSDSGQSLDNVPVKVKKISPNAIIPKYQTPGSSGFDLHAIDVIQGCVKLHPGDSVILHTGLSFVIPFGYEMQIRPRSGLAFKHDITVSNSPGTIDSDFRDECKIKIINHGKDIVCICDGDRIAQGVLGVVPIADFQVVEEFSDEDMNNDRKGGFGSTGLGLI